MTKHGARNNGKITTEYSSWLCLRDRCRNPNNKFYKDYGGRGIYVCKEWDDFTVFLADMGYRPKGYTLDRINNDGPYSPDNCRWATPKEQVANRRRVKLRDVNSPPRNNTTGFLGVTVHKQTGKYQAQYASKSLGLFSTPEEAHQKYVAYRLENNLQFNKDVQGETK